MLERRALLSTLAVAALAAGARCSPPPLPTPVRPTTATSLPSSVIAAFRATGRTRSARCRCCTYDEVRPWAKSIAKNVEDGTMPPWHADPSFGHFANDRRLDRERDRHAGALGPGRRARRRCGDRPAPPTFAETSGCSASRICRRRSKRWGAGRESDVIPKLIGSVMLPEDRWIQAVEFRPGNRKVLHHIIAFQVKGFGEPDPHGGWLGAWAAGTDPMVFPPEPDACSRRAPTSWPTCTTTRSTPTRRTSRGSASTSSTAR